MPPYNAVNLKRVRGYEFEGIFEALLGQHDFCAKSASTLQSEQTIFQQPTGYGNSGGHPWLYRRMHFNGYSPTLQFQNYWSRGRPRLEWFHSIRRSLGRSRISSTVKNMRFITMVPSSSKNELTKYLAYQSKRLFLIDKFKRMGSTCQKFHILTSCVGFPEKIPGNRKSIFTWTYRTVSLNTSNQYGRIR